MTLKARKYKIPEFKIRGEYEFIQVNRDVEGDPNDFGEPEMTASAVSVNTKATIYPIDLLSTTQLKMFAQGLIALSSHWMLIESDTDLKPRDTIVDLDGNQYSVEEVADWQNHKEALLKIAEKVIA